MTQAPRDPHPWAALLAACLVAVGGPVVAAAVWWRTAGRLPDPLPTHWDLAGRVDGTMPAGALAAVSLALATAFAAAGVAAARAAAGARGDRIVAAGLVWAAWLCAEVFVVPALLAVDASRGEDVALAVWAVPALLVVPLLAAAVVAALLPAPAGTEAAAPAPSTLELGPHERVVWVGQGASHRMLAVAALLVLVAVAVAAVAWPVSLVLVAVATLLLWTHVVTLRADDRALTVGWGPTRWPRLRVPIDVVEAAEETEVEPLRWGGWGYRWSPHGVAAVARRGPGIVVTRRGKPPLAVTVDRAHEAADVVNALVERHRRGGVAD